MKVMLCLVSSSVLPEKKEKNTVKFLSFKVFTIYLMIVNKKINNETRISFSKTKQI